METQFEDVFVDVELAPPPLPPLPPLRQSEQMNDASDASDASTIDLETNPNQVTEKLNRFIYKEPQYQPQKSFKWLYYPTFTILVTLAELGLLIWSITIDGFSSSR